MPTDWTTRKQQLRDRPQRPCEVSSCRLPIHQMGRYCLLHWTAKNSTGHPTAGRVSIMELRPYRKLAMHFIEQQQAAEHPGVLAAIEYLERRIATAVDTSSGSTAHLRPHQRVAFFLAWMRRDCLDPRLIVATGIAVELHSREQPHRWPDKAHADFQFGQAVACIARHRVRSGKSAGRSNNNYRKPAGFCLQLARDLRDPLLPLYVKAAQHLHETAVRASLPIPAAALSQPFTSGNAATTGTPAT